MADMQLAVGVRRAIVQDELGCAAAGVTQLLVDALVVPFLGPGGLALGQVAAHGEGVSGMFSVAR